ncbi:hypothetical protein TB2_031921 [Malus domestica]
MQKFKCALNVLRIFIKISTRWDFRDRRGELRNRRGKLKNQRGASFLKSWACSETTTNLLFQICPHLSHATTALDGISEIEEAIPYNGEASAFPDVSASVTCRVRFAEITGSLSKRQFQPSAFPDVSTSVTCRVSFTEITGSLSKCFFRHVNVCHMQSQLCRNHGQFVKAPIPDIEEALVFLDVSAPVTCTLSLAKITGNLSKISCEVESM